MRNRRIIVLSSLGLVLAIAVGVYWGFENLSFFEGQIKETDLEFESVEYESCYLIQSNFKSYQKDIGLVTLQSQKIYSNIQEPILVEDLGLTNVVSVDYENVYNYVHTLDENELVLSSLNEVDFRLKTMLVDGKNVWVDSDRSSYPLCVSKTTKVAKSDADSFRQGLYDIDGILYDFDFNRITSIFAGGEIIPARAVDRTWLNMSDNYTLLFDRFAKQIQESDVAVAMLENALYEDPTPCTGCMIFVGDEKNLQGFKDVGFDAFGVGNHFGDGGKNPIERTLNIADELGLNIAGASVESADDASAYRILEAGQKKIAFLSAEDVAAYYWFDTSFGTNRYSTKSSSGVSGDIDIEKIDRDIKAAKEASDFVIVMMSWGSEYTNKSNSHQQAMAHAIIDAGADLIVGSHPHWVQEIEIYKDRPIFYSLGNFVFDQTGEGPTVHWSRTNGETRQSVALQVFLLDDKIISIDIIPSKMCGHEQAGGESYNKTHNLAWKVESEEITYDEVDKINERNGCVWYQPTPVDQESTVYKAIWDRMMEYTDI